MADNLIAIPPSDLNTTALTQAIQQTGEKNIYASRVDNMNITVNATIPPTLIQPDKNNTLDVDTSHYSLFVTHGLDLHNISPFVIELDRALTEYMDDELKQEFSTLNDSAILRIKRFPSIFANENLDYGHTDEEQLLGLGYVKQLKIRRDGVKIYPEVQYLLSQQRLNEALFELDICGSDSFNEFNRTHWSIKKIDLIAELRELHFNI